MGQYPKQSVARLLIGERANYRVGHLEPERITTGTLESRFGPVGPMKVATMINKEQGIVRNNRGEEQPADKERGQNVNPVEEKKKTEDELQKTAEKSGF
jgi:hypothetical protein